MADNPCEIAQDTTYQPALEKVTPQPGARDVDCFYVYPTVSNQLTSNADKSRDPELVSIAKYQAARFNLQCRIFAPIYRQGTLAAIAAGYAQQPPADFELAYADVLEAWKAYLASDNGGRGVVLLGHSQGTRMLRMLLSREIEPDPAQHAKLVSALLLGGNVTVAPGQLSGGDFQKTPLCTQRAQLGCVVAFSTYFEDPSAESRFGRSTTTPGLQVACTDPRPLAGTTEPFRLLTPSEPFAPGPIFAGIVLTADGVPPFATTTWASPPDRFDGGCRTIDGAHVLRLDPQLGSRRPMWFPEPNWGTHLVDVNLALDPLVSLVSQQAQRWTATPTARTRAPGPARRSPALAGPSSIRG
jgi:hypothetical protein